MPTQEIKDADWEKFCQRFEDAHRGTLISIEAVYHNGTTAVLARNEPLRMFRFHKTEGCSDAIRLELGEPPSSIIQHQILDPIHVRLRQPEGAQKILEIDAESGSVELRFSSGTIGAILNELDLLSPQEMGREGGRRVVPR